MVEKRKIFFALVFVTVLFMAIFSVNVSSYALENNSESNDSTKFALIADPHISVSRPNKTRLLEKTIDNLNEYENIDFVINKGDLVDRGTDKNWKKAKSIIDDLKYPLFNLVGNHEYRESISDTIYPVFPVCFWKPDNESLQFLYECLLPTEKTSQENKWNLKFGPSKGDYRFDAGNTHQVVLDSGHDVISERDLFARGSGLTDEQIDWLKESLRGEENIFISMHHPLRTYFEGDYYWGITQNKDEFIEIAQNNDVEAVLTGHTHRTWEENVKGVRNISTGEPPTHYIIEYNENGDISVNLKEFEFVDEKDRVHNPYKQVWRGVQWTHLKYLEYPEYLYLVLLYSFGIFIISLSKIK